MKQISLILIYIGSFFLWSCREEKPVAMTESKPVNVVMISVDDLNSYLGFLGDSNAKTPNFDKLAASGVSFTNAHCQAPLCGPSRASIMTGLRPSSSGIYGMIDDDLITSDNEVTSSATFLPDYFRNHGYKTIGVGKIFHEFAPEGVFDVSAGRFAGDKPNHSFGPKPEQRMAWEGFAPEDGKKYGRTSTDWGAFPEQDSLMPDYQNTQWAINQLERQAMNDPFFLAIGYLRPHVPLHVPQKWFDLYPLDQIELPPYLKTDFDDIPDIAKNEVAYLPMMPTTDWAIKTDNWKKIVQAYLACISFVDNEIGKLLKALEQSPHANNTVIVLWSDHGYRMGEKGTFAKQCLWEEATKTPLIFSGPDLPRGKKIDAPVELLSIYPTLLNLCGLAANPRNEGIDLVPVMKGESDGRDFNAITTYGWNNHSVRTKDFSYIKYEDQTEELYLKSKDPNEFINLAGNPDYQAQIEQLKELLPTMNKPWHQHSSYTFQPYFVEQKERLNSGQTPEETN